MAASWVLLRIMVPCVMGIIEDNGSTWVLLRIMVAFMGIKDNGSMRHGSY